MGRTKRLPGLRAVQAEIRRCDSGEGLRRGKEGAGRTGLSAQKWQGRAGRKQSVQAEAGSLPALQVLELREAGIAAGRERAPKAGPGGEGDQAAAGVSQDSEDQDRSE